MKWSKSKKLTGFSCPLPQQEEGKKVCFTAILIALQEFTCHARSRPERSASTCAGRATRHSTRCRRA